MQYVGANFIGLPTGINTVMCTVDFGPSGTETFIQTNIVNQTWVRTNSIIVGSIFAEDNGERSVEDAFLEGLVVGISNIIAGTGFTVNCSAPLGAIGKFKIMCIGV